MSREWERVSSRFKEDLVREISATPTGERRNLLTDINLALMQLEDMDTTAKVQEAINGS